MNMPKIAVAVGSLLILQGVGFYVGTASKSVTALIPAFVGLPILVLGTLAFKESVRKHAMHAAAALGILGLLAAVGRIAMAGLRLSPAGVSLVIMVLLTGGFVLLCVKSFVDARRRQRASSNKP
jgi:hypothetical protein